MKTELVDAAKMYRAAGISIIPTDGHKRLTNKMAGKCSVKFFS